ncbi:hypothetical protein HJD18_15940 [Thermoleophilia bacterium SCSIO 60948]|nr:hypothetical protein HJD18_15940 [Thermoleophilia bacterium SCSIO 60948]
MKNNRLALIPVLLTLALPVAACGSDDSGSSGSSGSGETTVAAPDVPEAELEKQLDKDAVAFVEPWSSGYQNCSPFLDAETCDAFTTGETTPEGFIATFDGVKVDETEIDGGTAIVTYSNGEPVEFTYDGSWKVSDIPNFEE